MPVTSVQPPGAFGEKTEGLIIHPKREWMSTFGAFAEDPIFESAMDAGEAWAKKQTWEKEQSMLKPHAGA
jgi:hypothetical protein